MKQDKQINEKEISPISHANSMPVEFSTTVKLPTLKNEKYYDDITLFQHFQNSFKIAVHYNEYLSNIEKINYLLSYLDENAYNAISGFALSNKNYVEAIEVLKQQFNGKDLIVTSHINTL